MCARHTDSVSVGSMWRKGHEASAKLLLFLALCQVRYVSLTLLLSFFHFLPAFLRILTFVFVSAVRPLLRNDVVMAQSPIPDLLDFVFE